MNDSDFIALRRLVETIDQRLEKLDEHLKNMSLLVAELAKLNDARRS